LQTYIAAAISKKNVPVDVVTDQTKADFSLKAAPVQIKSETYPEVTIQDAIRQLRNGPVFRSSLDYEAALDICEEHGIAPFCPLPIRTEELRQTLFKLAILLKPFWAKVAYLGRDRVRAVLSRGPAQCLMYAGLLGPIDESVRLWWDELAAHFRSEQSQKLLEIGRQGEQLSFWLEIATLKELDISEPPVWISPEDNTAGYDILSHRRNEAGGLSELFIEAKATTTTAYTFILTRHEWDVAAKAGHGFRFHFWYLPTPTLWIATVEEVAPHIPVDSGSGRWEKVSLNFRGRKFDPVTFVCSPAVL
jgi:Domain of unknown function (DUF3883)